MKIKIIINETGVEGELSNTETAKKIYEALPLEADIDYWGNEIYFEVPLKCEAENPVIDVEEGDLAYWIEGSCFCIFYGETPASTSEKPRAVGPVNVFGKVRDYRIFKKKKAKRIRVERA